jgi:DNA-binding LacI/PurR family transcriptional regulator
MRATIYDIARDSGVSIATVSKVLNNTGRISEKTRIRVLQIVKELGYEPSSIASALAGKNTYSIGFLIPDIHNPFFSEIARGAEDEAFERGYSLFICSIDNNYEKEEKYLKTLLKKRIDGLVIATGTTTKQIVQNLMSKQIPIVLIARELPDVLLATVKVDNVHGGYLAAKHLLDLGHQSIGFIPEPLTIQSCKEILAGFQEALTEHGATLFVPPARGFGISSGFSLTKELLANHTVSAIFTANDQLAIGALEACKHLRKSIPDEISLVSYDNTIFSRIVTPALTTISQPIYELGKRTLQLLINGVESNIQPMDIILLQPNLIVRDSTNVPHVSL